jgi:predicted enzyme related to lactoylglutathione lyase
VIARGPDDAPVRAVLFARDLTRMADFYRETLSLEERRRDPDHVVLARPGFELIVHLIPAHVLAGAGEGAPAARREHGRLKICFPVASLARVRQRVIASGGVMDPERTQWDYEGSTVCLAHDPEGNVFQVRAPRE